MNAGARRLQRVYLVLLLLHTLAASFIWGLMVAPFIWLVRRQRSDL